MSGQVEHKQRRGLLRNKVLMVSPAEAQSPVKTPRILKRSEYHNNCVHSHAVISTG